MTVNIKDVAALTFDCYGTLIDWESGIWDAMQPLLSANNACAVDRQSGLEAFAVLESAQEASTPDLLYPALLTTVHHQIAEHFSLDTTAQLDQDFGQSVPYWPAFPDTADALRILKRHFKLVILSNVNRAGFAASQRKLGIQFDAIYTAEDVGSYKPDSKNFAYMLANIGPDLGIEKQQILHTAQSLHHDHVPASKFDLAKAWIDRQGLRDSDNWGATAKVENRPDIDFYFTSMMEMALHVQKEFA